LHSSSMASIKMKKRKLDHKDEESSSDDSENDHSDGKSTSRKITNPTAASNEADASHKSTEGSKPSPNVFIKPISLIQKEKEIRKVKLQALHKIIREYKRVYGKRIDIECKEALKQLQPSDDSLSCIQSQVNIPEECGIINRYHYRKICNTNDFRRRSQEICRLCEKKITIDHISHICSITRHVESKSKTKQDLEKEHKKDSSSTISYSSTIAPSIITVTKHSYASGPYHETCAQILTYIILYRHLRKNFSVVQDQLLSKLENVWSSQEKVSSSHGSSSYNSDNYYMSFQDPTYVYRCDCGRELSDFDFGFICFGCHASLCDRCFEGYIQCKYRGCNATYCESCNDKYQKCVGNKTQNGESRCNNYICKSHDLQTKENEPKACRYCAKKSVKRFSIVF
jgi:hypothetical protein